MKCIYLMLFCISCVINSVYAQQDVKSFQACHLQFQNKVGDLLLRFDSTYQNHFGETFRVRSCKYYISHIELLYKNGRVFQILIQPHLINEADSASKDILFAAPKGSVTGIRFLAGIDSITNTTGVQTGDMDPVKGMFWIWNTGYIMAKLEGSSSASKTPGKQYSYDVGGYKNGENAARQISLSLPSATNHQPSTFMINADISRWFWGTHDIKISEQPMCHSPGALAMMIADNYANMFSLSAQ